MKVVLDTNVIVSGFLNPHQAPGQILQRVAEGIVTPLLDTRLAAEYREVLLRPKFGLSLYAVDDFLDQMEAEGCWVSAKPLHGRLPDPDDEPFLEVALAGSAEALVTGNLKHYPVSRCAGMRVLAPRNFLDLLRE